MHARFEGHALMDGLLKILQTHQLVKRVRVVNYDETPAGKLEVKLRCQLVENYHFQIWVHYEPNSQDYSYQLFTDHPILRWDNAPHYPNIPSAPHHFHDENNVVSPSPLTGNMNQDLILVLREIETWMKSKINL